VFERAETGRGYGSNLVETRRLYIKVGKSECPLFLCNASIEGDRLGFYMREFPSKQVLFNIFRDLLNVIVVHMGFSMLYDCLATFVTLLEFKRLLHL
jgi:hypothetical protein